VEPPSGTVVVPAENEKEEGVPAPGSFEVKSNVPAAELTPSVTVPSPFTTTNPNPVVPEKPCEVITELVRLNVKPPTVHNIGSAVPKTHGAAKVALLPASPVNEPSPAVTRGPSADPAKNSHAVTVVAVPADAVSSCTVPVKLMFPLITAACDSEAKPKASAPTVITAMIGLNMIFILLILFGFVSMGESLSRGGDRSR